MPNKAFETTDTEKVINSLLTVNEAAQLLNLNKNVVCTFAREGIIPVVRIGRQIRFSHEALHKFIAEGGKQYAADWKKED